MGKSPQTGCKVEAYYRLPLGRLTKTVADSFWVDFLSSILSCVPRISACQRSHVVMSTGLWSTRACLHVSALKC